MGRRRPAYADRLDRARAGPGRAQLDPSARTLTDSQYHSHEFIPQPHSPCSRSRPPYISPFCPRAFSSFFRLESRFVGCRSCAISTLHCRRCGEDRVSGLFSRSSSPRTPPRLVRLSTPPCPLRPFDAVSCALNERLLLCSRPSISCRCARPYFYVGDSADTTPICIASARSLFAPLAASIPCHASNMMDAYSQVRAALSALGRARNVRRPSGRDDLVAWQRVAGRLASDHASGWTHQQVSSVVRELTAYAATFTADSPEKVLPLLAKPAAQVRVR